MTRTRLCRTAKSLVAAGVCLALAMAAGCASSGGAGVDLAVSPAAYVDTGGSETAAGLRLVGTLPAPANTNGGRDQLIGPNDVLDIDVFRVDDLDRTAEVDASGQISLPLIGSVEAGGRSVRLLEAELERLYGDKYLQSPDITVFVKESAGQRVTIDGEVTKAGIYPVTASSTLLQIIAQSGGFREVADRSKVYLFRDFGEKRLVTKVDVDAVRAGRQRDPRVFGGDVVVVFSSSTRVAIQNLKDALGLAGSAARLTVIP